MMLPVRGSKAFTLLELIVVIVILGILAGIAIPTFQKVIEKSKDNSAKQTLAALHREAAALAAFRGIGAFATDDVTQAGSDLHIAAGTGVHAAGTAVTHDTDAAPATSDAHGHVVYRISSDFSQLGLAMLSESGNCVTSLGTTSGDAKTTVHPAGACDGDLALTGTATAAPASEPAPTVSYTTGALDTTFDGDGIATTNILGHDMAYGLALQSDGKAVLAGQAHNGTNWDIAVVRYNADGSLDTTFSTDGKVTTAVGTGVDAARGVVVQSDGKIVVGGYAQGGTNDDFALVRYNADGSLDTTFSTDGIVTTEVAGADYGYALALQGDGKLVLSGTSYLNGSGYDVAVARYNTDGSLDTTFSTDGIVTTPIGAAADASEEVIVLGDGKLFLAAQTHNGTNNDIAAIRYNADGTLDTTFSADGIVVTPVGTGEDVATGAAVQSDGKLVVSGHSHNGTNLDATAVRYNADGSLDTTFSTDGIVTTPIGAGDDHGRKVMVQGDGKLLLGGYSHNGTNNDFAAVRYNADGSLDTTFDTDGKAVTPIGGNDVALGAVLGGDGKLLLGGYSHNGTNNDFAVVRYQ